MRWSSVATITRLTPFAREQAYARRVEEGVPNAQQSALVDAALHGWALGDAAFLASLAFSLHANQPGALLQALSCFAQLALNMSRIESRPSKREMGEYIFFVDLELPHGPEPLQQTLLELEPLCEHLAVFGAYPLTQLEAP